MQGHLKRGRIDGSWYLRIELPRGSNGRRQQRRETFRGTKAEAEKRLREMLREVEVGGNSNANRLAVEQIAERWLAAAEQRVSARTLQGYTSHVRLYIAPTLGSTRADTLRPMHIESAISNWAKGSRKDGEGGNISARTLAHVFNTLRTMLRWAVRMGSIVRSPADSVDPPRYTNKEMTALDPGKFEDVLAAAEGTEFQDAIAVAVGTGLRRGELLGLQWGDISIDFRKLAVRRSAETIKGEIRTKPPKTRRSARTLSLPSFVADFLRSIAAQRKPKDTDWVFVRFDGSQWEPGAFSLDFARFVKQSGLPHVRFHDLRHSFGTLALGSGVDLQTVSRALGHESVAITSRIYVHAVEALQEDQAARIDALLGDGVSSVMSDFVPADVDASVPQRCHKTSAQRKKPRKTGLKLVAPTGIEPVGSLWRSNRLGNAGYPESLELPPWTLYYA